MNTKIVCSIAQWEISQWITDTFHNIMLHQATYTMLRKSLRSSNVKPSSKSTPSSTRLKYLMHCIVPLSKFEKILHFLHTLDNSFRVVILSSFQAFTIKSIFLEIWLLLSSKLLKHYKFHFVILFSSLGLFCVKV